MSQQDISGYGNFGSQDPNAFYISQPNGVQGVDLTQNGDSQSISSISQSELEALITMLAAGVPILQFPNFVATNFNELSNNGVDGVALKASSYAQIAMLAEETKHEIITSMWDKYIEDIREASDRAKKDDIRRWTEDITKEGPKSAGEYLAYILALSSTRAADELGDSDKSALAVQFNQSFNYWFVNPVQQTDTSVGGVNSVDNSQNPNIPKDAYPDSTFVTGSIVGGSDLVRGALGAVGVAAGVEISLSPVSDAFFAVGPTTGLPMDTQAAAAMIAALLNGGAVSKATAQTIEEAASKGQPPRDLDFAKNYAKQIMAIITHEPKNAESLTQGQRDQNDMIKLMLATMALNMVYRAAYGGMSGEEFAEFFKPDNSEATSKLPPQIKSLVEQLLAKINGYLPTDPEKRSNLLVSLMEYVDSKDSVDSMLQTTRNFTQALSTNDIDQKRLQSKSG
jgi:hypothetical protein